MSDSGKMFPTSTHWGNYQVEVKDGRVVAVHPYAEDAHPTPIGQSLLNSQDPGCRIAQPMIRKGYLAQREASDGSQRGREPFVPVDWDTALDLAAGALGRVRDTFGSESIYGGSYGWASAGRFHHAQSQLHRFLNTIGGYSYSVTSYSAGAAEVIMPHILGVPFFELMFQAPTVADMVQHAHLVVCFGGIPMKNTQVMNGGLGAHTAEDQLAQLKEASIDFVNVSPIRDDVSVALGADWWACRPNSDVAIMLGLAHTLVAEGLHDEVFLAGFCEGFERFKPYLLGERDGQPKDADWAAGLSEIPAGSIRALARRMAAGRSVIGVSWSLQRAEHGEQTYWMATALAALLGTHGLPGGGVAYGYGSVHNIGFSGRRLPPFKVGALPQGNNPVKSLIPVSRISDMLLNPGAGMDYNGASIRFPDIRLIYWAGGNPFHHHQDLNRLKKAWAKPETVIINEPFWTAAARHADIVFPCTTPLERNDLGANSMDCYLTPMRRAVDPFAASRSDFDIFCGLSERLGVLPTFSEGRGEMRWVAQLYKTTRANAAEVGISLPPFDQFWAGEQFSIADQVPDREFHLEQLRRDPQGHPLKTPSGKIEIFSSTIEAFGYPDCGGHPMWFDKQEWLGAARATRFPLHLLSNQPKTRLHSQYDHGVTSQKAKVRGREVVRVNPSDAATRKLKDGDVVRLYNLRGACLAAVKISEQIRPGVIELPTGAWYDPQDANFDNSLEVHGNPNVLTRDVGTSRLAQGPSAHSCLVQMERFQGELPPIKILRPPSPEAPK